MVIDRHWSVVSIRRLRSCMSFETKCGVRARHDVSTTAESCGVRALMRLWTFLATAGHTGHSAQRAGTLLGSCCTVGTRSLAPGDRNVATAWSGSHCAVYL